MTRKLTLTALVALYLVVTLVGLVCLAAMGPLLAVVAFAGMAGNGFMAADWVGMIWNLDGQYDDGIPADLLAAADDASRELEADPAAYLQTRGFTVTKRPRGGRTWRRRRIPPAGCRRTRPRGGSIRS
jgi:hypothetical protein